jgi:hypothetical protein
MLTNVDRIDRSVLELLADKTCTLYISFETLRELVVLFNNKKIRSKQWKTAEDVTCNYRTASAHIKRFKISIL